MPRLILLLLCCAFLRAASLSAQQAAPECANANASGTCESHSATFAAPQVANGYAHRSLTLNQLKTYGPSINFGSEGGWTVTHVVEAPHIVFGTSGIDQYNFANLVKNGTGDLAGLYYYVYGGGRAAQADEGVTGATVESGEIAGYFHGTISGAAGPGATALTLTATADAPHQWKSTCDGCMLLDISKGTIAGRLNGRSQKLGSTYLYQLPTTAVTIAGAPAKLPLTRAWCTAATDIPQTDTVGKGTARTFDCTLGAIGDQTPAFTAGGVVTIAGPFYPEQAPLLAAGRPVNGVQSLTVLARNPNRGGAILFQGGIAGQSLSFDDNLAASGFRSSYYVFGSLDGVNLIYGSQIAGSIRSHELPRIGSEAEQTNSGFHLYPSAEIVANTAADSAPLLEPNAVPWETGDVVDNPRFKSFGGVGVFSYCSQSTPTDQDLASSCMMSEFYGPGVAGTYHGMRIKNLNPSNMYTGAGGVLSPITGITVEGPYGDLLAFSNGPLPSTRGSNAVIDVFHTGAGDNAPFNLFALPQGTIPGVTRVIYDPATKLIAFPQGLVAGSLGTSGNCASATANANCGSASAGSVAIPAGATSVTVFTSAVTTNSEILVTPDASLDSRLGIACNKNPATAFGPFGVVSRIPGRSFVLAIGAPAAGEGNCYSFSILN
jgi:hypothetical protein